LTAHAREHFRSTLARFQHYTLRLLGDEFFGRDVDILTLPLTCACNRPVGTRQKGGSALSAPGAAGACAVARAGDRHDIRDARPTFADIESRARATPGVCRCRNSLRLRHCGVAAPGGRRCTNVIRRGRALPGPAVLRMRTRSAARQVRDSRRLDAGSG
jgi:hypothetical protein